LNIFIADFDTVQFFRGGRRIGSVGWKDVCEECGGDCGAGTNEEVATRIGGGWVRLGVKLGVADFSRELRGTGESTYTIVQEG